MTMPIEQNETQDLTRAGAMQTVSRGLSLSPELRRGLIATIGLALIATTGRVIIPVAIQQVLDRGLSGERADMGFVVQMVLYALLAVAVTAVATGFMHLRLARVSEAALSGLRIRAFRHIHDLSMLHQASEQRGVLVARVTSDVDQISRFMQWGGLMMIVNAGQALLAIVVMFVYSVPLAITVVASVPIIVLTIRWFPESTRSGLSHRAREAGPDARHPRRGGRRRPGHPGVRHRRSRSGQAWRRDRGPSRLSCASRRIVRSIFRCR